MGVAYAIVGYWYPLVLTANVLIAFKMRKSVTASAVQAHHSTIVNLLAYWMIYATVLTHPVWLLRYVPDEVLLLVCIWLLSPAIRGAHRCTLKSGALEAIPMRVFVAAAWLSYILSNSTLVVVSNAVQKSLVAGAPKLARAVMSDDVRRIGHEMGRVGRVVRDAAGSVLPLVHLAVRYIADLLCAAAVHRPLTGRAPVSCEMNGGDATQ